MKKVSNFKQVIAEINQGKVARSYFLYGREVELQDQLIEEISSAFLNRIEREVNYFVRYASETPVETLSQLMQSGGLFSERKVIVYRDYDQARNPRLNYLTHFLESLHPDLVFIVTSRDEQVKGKKFKPLLEYSLVVHLRPLGAEELAAFVHSELARQGKRLAPGALELLIEHTGNYLNHVKGALDQLCNAFPDREEIGRAEIEQVVGDYALHTVFEYTERVLSGQRAQAHVLLHQLLEKGENPQGIMYWLLRHLSTLWKIRGFLHSGERRDAVIQRELGLYPRQYQRYKKQALQWKSAALRQAILILKNTDMAFKTSQAPPDILLDLITSKLVNLQ
ncbi:MAG: DNA polymerase III subunit delta [Calditrichaeota bacterium]|nr:MAG: DNA polymerase III subunit delta [Calditrichota bacterium]